jgi:hypothetical protein
VRPRPQEGRCCNRDGAGANSYTLRVGRFCRSFRAGHLLYILTQGSATLHPGLRYIATPWLALRSWRRPCKVHFLRISETTLPFISRLYSGRQRPSCARGGLEPHLRVLFSAIFPGVSLENFHQGRNLWKVAEAKVWSVLVNPRTFFVWVLIIFYLTPAGL